MSSKSRPRVYDFWEKEIQNAESVKSLLHCTVNVSRIFVFDSRDKEHFLKMIQASSVDPSQNGKPLIFSKNSDFKVF